MTKTNWWFVAGAACGVLALIGVTLYEPGEYTGPLTAIAPFTGLACIWFITAGLIAMWRSRRRD